jgi:hypothetical protein
MKRMISFSLYGSHPLYLEGAVRNVLLQPAIYPGWTVRVYASQEIPQSLVMRLTDGGAEVVRMQRRGLIDGMFWRFLPAAEADVDALVVRDVDSRLTVRERAAVEEWLASGRAIHIMRDHPFHKVPMLGGMWGCRGGAIPDMQSLIQRWKLWGKKGHDQDFLRNAIYPRFRHDCLVHSDLYAYPGEEVRPFPLPRSGGEFVGCVYDPDRDTLTAAQEAELAPQLAQAHFRRLPALRHRLRIYLFTEYLVRKLTRRGDSRRSTHCPA